ncbi:MAG TPA: histidinol-phosphatase [Melioribacteraceae bacterium]|nr:histidinol-phosphatase [Melioribacteraceae bacterium]
MSELNELKKFCKYLSDESSKIIKPYFRTTFNIESKIDESPVTIADKKAEEKMRELINKEFPNHGIIGEEYGITNPNAEYKWILDPIDGTKSFICGAYTFGTMIGLLHNNKPVLGVINQPILDEFLLGDNENTYLNDQKVMVKNKTELKDAVLLSTDHLNIEKYQDITKFNSLIHKVKLYRLWGDCYGYLLLACGYADIMIDPIMNIWDLAALVPIVNGAGGIITDYNGKDAITGQSTIACVPGLHKKVIDILN